MKLSIIFALLLFALTADAGKSITTTRSNSYVRASGSTSNITRPNIIGPGGMQVNSFTGNLFYQRQDVFIPGRGIPIDVTFSYNSGGASNDWGMGRGWTSTFNMMYERKPGFVIMRGEDGRKDTFTVSGVTYTAPAGVFNVLSEYAPGKFLLRTRHGVKFFFDDSTHKKLTKVEDPNGNALTFGNFVPPNQPSTITDANGRSIGLGWSGGHLAYIIDSIASPSRTTTYQYDVRGNMTRVTDPLGNIYRYQYDVRGRLTKFTDELSHEILVAYADSGAVSGITSPAGSGPATNLSISYNPSLQQTVASELVGATLQSTTYTFDSFKRAIRVQGNCCGSDVQYQYDAQNNTTRKTDANGNATDYTYDSKGNLLSENDALGQTALWTYEPTFSRVISATDKRGNTTSFSYDARGNLLSGNRPLGIVESFTYDVFGNRISATDGRGNTTTYTYNSSGEVVGIAHPIGSESFSYDNSGNLTSWTDPNSRTTSYAYDALDRMVSMTNAISGTRLFTWGGAGLLLQETDEMVRNTLYNYDDHDRVIAISKPGGRVATFLRDARGNVTQSMDFKGNLTSYVYDTKNRLVTLTNPLGHSQHFTYDNHGNLLTKTDFNGNLTSHGYDVLHRRTSTVNALSQLTTMTYDPNNNLATVTDANGRTTTSVYDALDRRVQVIHPIGIRDYTYDNNGNLLTHTDPGGHTTTYSYDANNRRTSALDPLSHTTSFTYDPAGNVLSVTDPNSLTSTYAYDGLHRMTTASNPMSEVTAYTYDAVSKLITESLPYGRTLVYSFDVADRVTSISDGLGLLTSHTYDANSNMLTETDGNGNTTQYTYDALDRPTSAIAPLGQSNLVAYDNNSNIVSRTDGAGNATTYTYDAVNRKLTETFPGGATTTSAYDPVGNLVGIIDSRGNTTSFMFDAMDRATQVQYADGSSRHFTHDVEGNLTATLDQNGTTINYSYDAMHRMTARNGDTYSYDNAGRRLTANNATATISFTYDNAGRTLSEVLNGKTTAYSYNIPGRTVTMTYPSGRVVTNTMDQRLLTTSLQSGASTVASYSYDAGSRLVSQVNGNGTSTSYTHNNNDWTTAISHSGPFGQVAEFNYTFDARGFRTSAEKLHRPANSEKYVYNPTTRLTQFQEGTLIGGNIPSPVTQTQFTFDAIGNRTTSLKDSVFTNYSTNTINAYTNISGGIAMIPTYDANGNMTFDGTRTYIYDFMDRLQSSPSGPFGYGYDALGRRVRKADPGEWVNYYYDGDEVIEETTNLTDSLIATYVHGQGVDDKVQMTVYAPSVKNYYYHKNSLGSTIAMTDDSGSVVERYEYDAFGKVSIFDDVYTPRTNSAIKNKYLFTGRELDRRTGFYYYRARHYNPLVGRFMQQDPLLWGDAPDIRNGYSYVANNPVNYVDPSGAVTIRMISGTREAATNVTALGQAVNKALREVTENNSDVNKKTGETEEERRKRKNGENNPHAGKAPSTDRRRFIGGQPNSQFDLTIGSSGQDRLRGMAVSDDEDLLSVAIKNKGVQGMVYTDDEDLLSVAIKNKGVQGLLVPGDELIVLIITGGSTQGNDGDGQRFSPGPGAPVKGVKVSCLNPDDLDLPSVAIKNKGVQLRVGKIGTGDVDRETFHDRLRGGGPHYGPGAPVKGIKVSCVNGSEIKRPTK